MSGNQGLDATKTHMRCGVTNFADRTEGSASGTTRPRHSRGVDSRELHAARHATLDRHGRLAAFEMLRHEGDEFDIRLAIDRRQLDVREPGLAARAGSRYRELSQGDAARADVAEALSADGLPAATDTDWSLSRSPRQQVTVRLSSSCVRIHSSEAQNRPHDWAESREPVTLCRVSRHRFVLKGRDARKPSPPPDSGRGLFLLPFGSGTPREAIQARCAKP